MDESKVAKRESIVALFKKLAKDAKYDAVLVTARHDEDIETLWIGDNIELYTMAALGKKTVWDIMVGKLDGDYKEIEDEETDWDISKL